MQLLHGPRTCVPTLTNCDRASVPFAETFCVMSPTTASCCNGSAARAKRCALPPVVSVPAAMTTMPARAEGST